jgi:hypothetical protein
VPFPEDSRTVLDAVAKAPPPEDFAKRPHLVLELDGSKPEGYLFKLTF